MSAWVLKFSTLPSIATSLVDLLNKEPCSIYVKKIRSFFSLDDISYDGDDVADVDRNVRRHKTSKHRRYRCCLSRKALFVQHL